MRNLMAVLFCGSAALSSTAFADPPTRVGRINQVMGEVSFRPAGVEEWAPAGINRPVMTGDQLWSAGGSRAELHVGSTAVRIGHDTDFSVLQLDDRFTQLRVGQGSADVKVRRLEPEEVVELDLPAAAVQLVHPGSYRVDFWPNDARSRVVVRSGEAQVTVNGSTFNIEEGQSIEMTGTDQPQYEMRGLPGFDEFDRWSVERDQREDNPQALRYVPREMTGYEDLDANGSWSESPEGAVWYPNNVGYGWQPYHNGHWAWIDPYGWTWCGDEAWGFAPYHYGRWSNYGGRWGWYPGRFNGRPIYAPALVGWVGGGGTVVIEGGGPVGWFPLGPREVYVPQYGVSDRYFERVNGPYARVTTVREYDAGRVQYVNRGYTTAVPRETFVGARPVQGAVIAHPVYYGGGQGTVMAHPYVNPTGQSVIAHPVGRAYAPPPREIGTRPVVAVHTPPAPAQPFGQRQQAIQQNGGRPVEVQRQPVNEQPHPLVRPVVVQPQQGRPYGQPVQQQQVQQQQVQQQPARQDPVRPGQPVQQQPGRPYEPARQEPARPAQPPAQQQQVQQQQVQQQQVQQQPTQQPPRPSEPSRPSEPPPRVNQPTPVRPMQQVSPAPREVERQPAPQPQVPQRPAPAPAPRQAPAPAPAPAPHPGPAPAQVRRSGPPPKR